MTQTGRMMKEQRCPEMSVVLVTPDRYETIRKTMEHLCAQTAQARLEMVIVAPSRDRLGLEERELEGFARWCVVEIGALKSLSAAHAAGVRQASAPVVGFAEDHSFADTGWAAALIAAHRQPWAAAGPAMRNANPDSAISWADFFIGYGRWLEPVAAGVIDHLPGHNSSYKREALLHYGERLEEMLEAAAVLHADLRSRGQALYLEPAATVSHLNSARLSSWLRIRFYAGRAFGAARARHWSISRRLLYILGSPLIPVVRVCRTWRESRRPGNVATVLRALPALLAGLIVDAAGEIIGYGWGAGNMKEKEWDYEFHRERYA